MIGDRETCGFEWDDGWGHHFCWMIKDHDRQYHSCMCDQTIRVLVV